MKRTILTIGTAALVAVPAAMGLIGNTSFAQSVPVRVPPQATVVDHHGSDHHGVDDKGGQRTTRTPEPGDDKGGQRTTRTPEPGDDKGGQLTTRTPEPADDNAGQLTTRTPEPGDDKMSGSGGHGGDSSGKGGGDDGSGQHASGHL